MLSILCYNREDDNIPANGYCHVGRLRNQAVVAGTFLDLRRFLMNMTAAPMTSTRKSGGFSTGKMRN